MEMLAQIEFFLWQRRYKKKAGMSLLFLRVKEINKTIIEKKKNMYMRELPTTISLSQLIN